MVLAWPATAIKDDKGKDIESVVSLEVPAEVPLMKALKDIITRTNAYAILVCDSTEDELRVVIESHHGVRAWTTDIKRHGDVRVLGDTKVRNGTGGFNLLWKKQQGSG